MKLNNTLTLWALLVGAMAATEGGVAANPNDPLKFEKPRIANPKPPKPAPKRPDLVVKDIRLVKECKIQVVVTNQGTAGVPAAAYPRAGVQLYRNNRPWGGLVLSAFDTQKRLQTPGGTVRREWFAAPNLQLTPGTHTLKLVLQSAALAHPCALRH